MDGEPSPSQWLPHNGPNPQTPAPQQKKRRWPLALAGVGLAVLAMAVIGSLGDDDETETATATTTTRTATTTRASAPYTASPVVAPPAPAAARAPLVTNDKLFLATLTMLHVDVNDPDAMVNLGQAVCDDLDKGLNFTAIGFQVTGASNGMYSLTDVGHIMGAAVSAFCPAHKADMPGGG